MSDTLTYFLSGGFGGICTVLVGHPLDTVKVRLQTMATPKPGEKPQYTGTLDCLKKTIASEGVTGLYKGMGAPLAAVAPIFAISFLGYGVGKKLFSSSEDKGTPWQYFAAGGVAGFFTTFVMSPGERIKSLLQVQKGEGEKLYNGPLDCAVKLYKQGGIRSIYKGSVATLMRDVPASGLYYLTYDCIKDVLTEGGKTDMGIAGAIFAGGMAGVTHWAIGMPADVIKSRLQTAPEGSFPNGARDVVKDLLKKEGPLAFYKGITPVLLRAFPANAACFVGFEVCQQFLRKLFSS